MSGYELGFIILCFGIAANLCIIGFKYKPPTQDIHYHND